MGLDGQRSNGQRERRADRGATDRIERLLLLLSGAGGLVLCAILAVLHALHPSAPSPFSRVEKEFTLILRQVMIGGGLAGAALIAIALAAPRSRWVGYAVTPISRAILVTGCLAFALGLTEVALFITYRDVQVGGDGTPSGFTFYRHYHLNSRGFRDLERTVEKPPGTFRILALGDSFTFGAGVRDADDVYTRVLESRLAARSMSRIEVINLSKKGWSTEQERRAMRNEGWDYSPDLVVLGYYLNDPETEEIKKALAEASRSARILPYPYGKFLYAMSFTYYITERKLMSMFPSRFGYEFPWEERDYYVHIHNPENLAAHRRILAGLVDDIQGREIPIVILIFPQMFLANDDPYPYASMHAHVKELAESKDVLVVDLLDTLRASSLKRFTVSRFDDHPNVEVHRVAAERLFAELTAHGLVPVPGRERNEHGSAQASATAALPVMTHPPSRSRPGLAFGNAGVGPP